MFLVLFVKCMLLFTQLYCTSGLFTFQHPRATFLILYISDWSVIQWLLFAAVNQQISHASQSCCVFDWQTQQSSYIYFSPGNWVEEEYLWHRHFVIWKHVERLRRKYNIYFLPVRASQQKATI